MKKLNILASFSKSKPNPFQNVAKSLNVGNNKLTYYSLPDLGDKRFDNLPYSVRILLESAIRNCDEFEVQKQDAENILNW